MSARDLGFAIGQSLMAYPHPDYDCGELFTAGRFKVFRDGLDATPVVKRAYTPQQLSIELRGSTWISTLAQFSRTDPTLPEVVHWGPLAKLAPTLKRAGIGVGALGRGMLAAGATPAEALEAANQYLEGLS